MVHTEKAPSVNSPREHQQEQLVRDQGMAYGRSYDMLMADDPHAEIEVDDYVVTASFEPAEGMYVPSADGALRWATPRPDDNQHFEVIVRDRRDGRFLPELDVHLRLYRAAGDGHGQGRPATDGEPVVDTHVPFIWHPFVLHYGLDGTIPGEGDYVAEISIPRPPWNRHDEVRGERYVRDVTVRVGPVHLEPGIKPHGAE